MQDEYSILPGESRSDSKWHKDLRRLMVMQMFFFFAMEAGVIIFALILLLSR